MLTSLRRVVWALISYRGSAFPKVRTARRESRQRLRICKAIARKSTASMIRFAPAERALEIGDRDRLIKEAKDAGGASAYAGPEKRRFDRIEQVKSRSLFRRTPYEQSIGKSCRPVIPEGPQSSCLTRPTGYVHAYGLHAEVWLVRAPHSREQHQGRVQRRERGRAHFGVVPTRTRREGGESHARYVFPSIRTS